MTAGVTNLTVESGATFTRTFKWLSDGEPVNLTGASAKLQVREYASADSSVLFEASTENGRLVITPLLGEIAFTITAAESAAFAWTFGKYDLLVTTASGTVYRLLQGKMSVSAQVTR